MKSKLNKILLLGISIVVVIIIIVSSILILMTRQKIKPVYREEPQAEEDRSTVVETQNVISEAKYYSITTLIRKYYNAINKDNYRDRAGNSFAEDESVKQSIYDMISKEYIERNNIQVNNIYEHLEEINNSITFVPTNIEVSEGFTVDKYLVQGILMETLNEEKYKKVQIFVNIDNKNNTFSIEPIEQTGDIQIKNSEQEIKENEYNSFKLTILNDQELSKEKFNNLKMLILRKSEALYNMFDEEYRSKKFGDYQGYVQYVEDNYERLSTMYMTKYKVKEYDNYKQYTCLDQENNYFIFNTVDSNNTKIVLDTYTVDLPEFVEKYDKAKDSTKVGYNIERFISAIDDKDYKYAYNCLDEVYRRNNMPTLESFENYIKRNLYDKNKVEHGSIEKQGNNYIYEITIKDQNNTKSVGKKMTIIMQLEQGTDFVMSFNMD